MKAITHRFTATLKRPQGARIFKGTMNGCPGMSEAVFVCRELLLQNRAFEEDVTSIKITIFPIRRNADMEATPPRGDAETKSKS